MTDVNEIYFGKHQEILKDYPADFFDSCVTDPPYGINFMNKHWDYDVPSVEDWKGILRVLKPGAHILVACGTRTQHRMIVNVEDAGFEIRDVITWHYGSGFPKSLDISKAIDKQAGAEREVICKKEPFGREGRKSAVGGFGTGECDGGGDLNDNMYSVTAPATEAAKQWEGWGTALKPATEFWTLARKPISENTIAENVLLHGTGGINIDGSRIPTNDSLNGGGSTTPVPDGWDRPYRHDQKTIEEKKLTDAEKLQKAESLGRFPANVIFDEFTGKILDEQSGELTSGYMAAGTPRKNSESEGRNTYGKMNPDFSKEDTYADSGGASRFFYCPKADNYERNKGLEKFNPVKVNDGRETEIDNAFQRGETLRKNTHPTVKPIDLMRYLVKLITPKNGICLDPYCGSGTTLIGCKLELIKYVGIDKVENHCQIAEARVAAWNPDKYIAQT